MKRTLLALAILLIGIPTAFAASSRDNRGDRFIYFGYTPVGLHIPTLLTQPVSFGIILGESIELGAEIGSWNDSETDGNDVIQGEFTNSGAVLKWFPGTNSFYISLSAHKREWEVNVTSTLSTSAQVTAKLKSEATVAGFGIGNQWMYDIGLFISVDWVVLSSTVSESSTYTITSNVGALTGAELTEAQNEFRDAGDTLNDWSGFPGAVMLTIGFAF